METQRATLHFILPLRDPGFGAVEELAQETPYPRSGVGGSCHEQSPGLNQQRKEAVVGGGFAPQFDSCEPVRTICAKDWSGRRGQARFRASDPVLRRWLWPQNRAFGMCGSPTLWPLPPCPPPETLKWAEEINNGVALNESSVESEAAHQSCVSRISEMVWLALCRACKENQRGAILVTDICKPKLRSRLGLL